MSGTWMEGLGVKLKNKHDLFNLWGGNHALFINLRTLLDKVVWIKVQLHLSVFKLEVVKDLCNILKVLGFIKITSNKIRRLTWLKLSFWMSVWAIRKIVLDGVLRLKNQHVKWFRICVIFFIWYYSLFNKYLLSSYSAHIGKAWQQRKGKSRLDTGRKQGIGRFIFTLKWILKNVNLLKHRKMYKHIYL